MATYTVISGGNKSDFAPIIINDGHTDWRLVNAHGFNAILEAQEHREIGYEPRTRTMSIANLRVILGWNTQANIAIINGETVVINDDIENGFMVAEPIWAKPDEAAIRTYMAQMREEIAMARDCDRAASFGMW